MFFDKQTDSIRVLTDGLYSCLACADREPRKGQKDMPADRNTDEELDSYIRFHGDVLRLFVTYLDDLGIQGQLMRVLAGELSGLDRRAMLRTAIYNIQEVNQLGICSFDLLRVAMGAPSLEFLVDCAHKCGPAIFPPNAIPSDHLVQVALERFHNYMMEKSQVTQTSSIEA